MTHEEAIAEVKEYTKKMSNKISRVKSKVIKKITSVKLTNIDIEIIVKMFDNEMLDANKKIQMSDEVYNALDPYERFEAIYDVVEKVNKACEKVYHTITGMTVDIPRTSKEEAFRATKHYFT